MMAASTVLVKSPTAPSSSRNHHRSQSAEELLPASFAYSRPSTELTDDQGPTRSSIGGSTRRAKLFGFTPATEEQERPNLIKSNSTTSSSSTIKRTTPRDQVSIDTTPTASTSTLTSSSISFLRTSSTNDVPLVPLHFRPSHLVKSASDYPAPSTYADDIRGAFSTGRQTPMVRKKSGELVRSSLKFGEMTRIRAPAKSAPSSPTTSAKIVHFDNERLEEVKPFLSRQRPAAVSRSGSPIETETEDEPEAFPFPAMTTSSPGLLSLRLPNFPRPVNVEQEACLEDIMIAKDGKSLRGIIRVQNISFQKWVAVRFTLDHWTTVSEVSADYLETIVGANADRFVFSIRLQDLLAKIEEKTMFIAVRYRIEGREIWDNNGGANYEVRFTKSVASLPSAPATLVKLKMASSSTSSAASGSSNTSTATTTPSRRLGNNAQHSRQAEALRRKLNLLVADDFDPAPIPTYDQHYHARVRSFTEDSSSSATTAAAAPTAFNSRYDFGSASPSAYRQPSSSSATVTTTTTTIGKDYSTSSSASSTTTYGSPIGLTRHASTLSNSPPSSSASFGSGTFTSATMSKRGHGGSGSGSGGSGSGSGSPSGSGSARSNVGRISMPPYQQQPQPQNGGADSLPTPRSPLAAARLNSPLPSLRSLEIGAASPPSMPSSPQQGSSIDFRRRSSLETPSSSSASSSLSPSPSTSISTFAAYRPLVPHSLPPHIARARKLVSSPLASPAHSPGVSPGGSPPRSGGLVLERKNTREEEEEREREEEVEREEKELRSREDFSNFLDRYCFHTSSTSSTSLGLSNLDYNPQSSFASHSTTVLPSSTTQYPTLFQHLALDPQAYDPSTSAAGLQRYYYQGSEASSGTTTPGNGVVDAMTSRSSSRAVV